MTSNPKVHAFEDVVKHNNFKDCWLIIHGKVYDVTPFLDEHPGGEEVMLSSAGKDATQDYEDIAHSDYAKELMQKYYIGSLDMSTTPQKLTYVPSTQQTQYKSDNFKFLIKFLQVFVPVLVLISAFAVRQYYL